MRLKEKLIIALIIIMTLLLALLPVLMDRDNDDLINSEGTNIRITVEGEINAIDSRGELTNKITIEVPGGSSYMDIISRVDIYLTRYSIIDSNLGALYFSDAKILIKSSNRGLNKNNSTKGKLCLNTASKRELMSLPGIKESRAEKIIGYRKNKKIESYSELKKILGLSDDAIENIKKQAFL